MKIALINGSPKFKSSASGSVLAELKLLLSDACEIAEFHLSTCELSNEALEQMASCDALVFAFPLYVDAIPSHLVSCLHRMEMFFRLQSSLKIAVYALSNGGFYEGRQNEVALEMMNNWCEKSGFVWGQGIGIGGGGMMSNLSAVPLGQGPKKNLGEALKALVNNICTKATADSLFISPNFPGIAYKFAAQMGWRQQAKANGLKKRDLFRVC